MLPIVCYNAIIMMYRFTIIDDVFVRVTRLLLYKTRKFQEGYNRGTSKILYRGLVNESIEN